MGSRFEEINLPNPHLKRFQNDRLSRTHEGTIGGR
jgi:hypothetical protein